MVEQPTPFAEEHEPVTEEPEPEEAPQSYDAGPRHRRARRNWGGTSLSGPLLGGLVLILLGLVFLLQNMGLDLPILRNWWAFFILIPAVGSFERAWQAYQRSGQRITNAVTGPLVGAVAMTMVVLVFLFDLQWSLMWPIFLILVGLGALFTAMGSR